MTRARRTLPFALPLALLLGGCAGPSDALLTATEVFDPSVRERMSHEEHGAGIGHVPRPDWCRLSTWEGPAHAATTRGVGSLFHSQDGTDRVAAKLVDHSGGSTGAGFFVDMARATAADCEDQAAETDGWSIEPLTGLTDGEYGWQTYSEIGRDGAPEWGAYVVVELNYWQVLHVGFTTQAEDPPVDIHELVALAREKAAPYWAHDR